MMLPSLRFLPFLLLAPAATAQTTYTHTLPNMEGSSLSSWRNFTFPAAEPTTGGAELDFFWLACWQAALGGSSQIWIELQIGATTWTQVYYETGNVSECAQLYRTVQVPGTVMQQALAAGSGAVNGRVRVNDACYPGVGCSFYNDPVVGSMTLAYEVHAADFAAADANVCPGSTVAFTDESLNTPSSYEWLFPGGVPANSTQQDPTVQYPASGSYTVTLIVETADGMDTLVRSAFVTVHALPAANAGVDEHLCTGDEAELQASGGVTYQWFPADGLDDPESAEPVAAPSSSTTYTVLVTDANGCQASDAMVLSVHDLPVVETSAGDASLCGSDTLAITAEGAQLYQWSPNLFISAISGAQVEVWPLSSSSWTVTGTDAFGCVNTATVNVEVHPLPPVPQVTDLGMELVSSPAAGHQWLLNGAAIPGATAQTWVPQENGAYSVRITDANGCSATSAAVYFGTVGLGDPRAITLNVYPRPVRDVLRVDGLAGTAACRVVDVHGRYVLQGTLSAGTLDVSTLAPGRYVLELLGKEAGRRSAFVKE